MKDEGYILSVQFWVEQMETYIKYQENQIKILQRNIEFTKGQIKQQVEIMIHANSN
jgi:hypothetical protein